MLTKGFCVFKLFKTDGSVELINTAAKHLLNINSLKKINGLERIGKSLIEAILRLKSGESTVLKLESNQNTMYLSIRATQLKLRGEWHTLISLQNIQGEIQREQMARELEIAWDVQKSLLPDKNPTVPGYDIAGMCNPAKEVGGDYYDFIPLGKNKIAIVIGDVSGKGTQASFYMTLTKGFIMSLLKENKSLKRVLIDINKLMIKTIKTKVFVTMYLVILDWNLNRLFCARAGHNPALHYSSKNKKCFPVKPDGIALGLIENGSFSETIQESSLNLARNDWLILYTDGLTEAMNSELNCFGEKGLIETIKGNPNTSASQMTETIFETVQNYACCDVHHDDMTLICIKRI